MTAINRAPVGWLGFLGIKNFGRNPSTAAEVLAPTWDLSELYLATNRTWATVSSAITGLNQFAFNGPPAGQVWYVHSAGVITNALVAGNDVDCQMALYNEALGQSSPLIFNIVNPAPAVGARVTAAIPHPVVLNPGEALALHVTRFAGAAISFTGRMVYTRLDA